MDKVEPSKEIIEIGLAIHDAYHNAISNVANIRAMSEAYESTCVRQSEGKLCHNDLAFARKALLQHEVSAEGLQVAHSKLSKLIEKAGLGKVTNDHFIKARGSVVRAGGRDR